VKKWVVTGADQSLATIRGRSKGAGGGPEGVVGTSRLKREVKKREWGFGGRGGERVRTEKRPGSHWDCQKTSKKLFPIMPCMGLGGMARKKKPRNGWVFFFRVRLASKGGRPRTVEADLEYKREQGGGTKMGGKKLKKSEGGRGWVSKTGGAVRPVTRKKGEEGSEGGSGGGEFVELLARDRGRGVVCVAERSRMENQGTLLS